MTDIDRAEALHPYTPPMILESDADRRENRIAGWYRFFIGDIEATIISDGRLRPGSPEEQFPSVPKETLHRILRRHYLPTSGLIMEQNSLALKIGGKIVLFDTGVGFDVEFGSDESGRLLRNMRAAGIDPADVTKVVLTHAHCDHCWGLVGRDGAPIFPNAELFIAEKEFEFWTDEGKLSSGGFIEAFVTGARRSLLPYKNRLRFVSDGHEVVSSVTAVSSPGHSIGHTSYLISSAGADFLLLGDVAHSSSLLFENPDWGFFYDYDPPQAAKTRRRLFERAVAENLSLIGYHFLFPGVGNIRPEGSAFSYISAPILHK
jgi:glyoxylase-like metal-dependent hydrolase (beta-lactamase superfamily II)